MTHRIYTALLLGTLLGGCAGSKADNSAHFPANSNSVAPLSSGCQNGSCPVVTTAQPLLGCPQSHYLISTQAGSPQASSLLIFDTGSGAIAVPTAQCQTCNTNTFYQAAANALQPGPEITLAYGGGNHGWTGNVYDDVIQFSGVAPLTMKFGGITSVFGGLVLPVRCVENSNTLVAPQGIFGINRMQTPRLDNYVSDSNSPASVFAVQLCDVGGQTWMGGYDPNFTSEPPRFITAVTGTGAWTVVVDSMTVGNSNAIYPPTNLAIVDTGTYGLALPQALYTSLTTTLAADPNVSKLFDPNFITEGACAPLPAGFTRSQLDATLPTLTINLGQKNTSPDVIAVTELTLAATQSYLNVRYDTAGNTLVCPDVSVSANNFVLGDAVMRSHVFIFDSVNDQIGLAPQVGCDTIVRNTLPTLQ